MFINPTAGDSVSVSNLGLEISSQAHKYYKKNIKPIEKELFTEIVVFLRSQRIV